MIESFFADGGIVVMVRKDNIGLHTSQLGRTTVHAVEFLDGQFHLSQRLDIIIPFHTPVEIEEPLNRPLSEGAGAAHDHGPPVILQSGSKDLGCRSTVFIHHHNERAIILDPCLLVPVNIRRAFPVLYLDDRALVDEQARHLHHIIQGTSPVIPQIQDDPVYLFFLELIQLDCHILITSVSFRIIEIGIKPGQFDIPDLVDLAGKIDDCRLHKPVIKDHLIANDRDLEALAIQLFDMQCDFCAFLSTDL